jgi:hypothetical protein
MTSAVFTALHKDVRVGPPQAIFDLVMKMKGIFLRNITVIFGKLK